jgi:GTP-binding protein Era
MKSAVVTLIGRPSSGKSSLLNRICGHKVSIVSAVPQTTRNRIRGVHTDERGQFVFLDTPGYHLDARKFNLLLQGICREALEESDLILYVVDVTREAGEEEAAIRTLLAPLAGRLVTALNKVDLAGDGGTAARVEIERALTPAPVVLVSATTGAGRDDLLAALFAAAPEGDLLYPDEFYTDQPPEFRIAEMVREKVMLHTSQEVPHAVYVEIADMEMRSEGRELWVRGFICVERESQKGIVIGRGGEKIRTILSEAAADLNGLFPYRLSLDFRVRVRPRWRRDDRVLKKLIY